MMRERDAANILSESTQEHRQLPPGRAPEEEQAYAALPPRRTDETRREDTPPELLLAACGEPGVAG